MKGKLLTVCVLNVIAFSASAADTRTTPPMYVRADIGYNFFKTPAAKTGSAVEDGYVGVDATSRRVANNYGYTLGLGYQCSPEFRSDITFTHRPKIDYRLADDGGDLAKGELDNYTLMLNGYYDFNLNTVATPYLMAGVGFSRNATGRLSANGVYESGKSFNQLAWQVGAGAAYTISNNLKLDLNYQYIDLNTFRNSGNFNYGEVDVPSSWSRLKSNQIQAGIRYYF